MSVTPGIVQAGRRLHGTTFLDRAVVSDRSSVRTAGGTTETFTERPGDPLPCRFGRVTDAEATQAQGIAAGRAVSAVNFPVGTEVAEGSRLRNVATDRVWVVVGNLTPESVYQVVVRLMIREL